MLPLFVSEAHGRIIQGQAPGTGGLSSMAQGHPITCFTKDQQGWKLEKWEMDRGHRRGRTPVTPSLGARDPHPLSPGAQAALGGKVRGGHRGVQRSQPVLCTDYINAFPAVKRCVTSRPPRALPPADFWSSLGCVEGPECLWAVWDAWVPRVQALT